MDTYSKLYHAKKEQLSGQNKSIQDLKDNFDKSPRASSATPPPRSNSVISPQESSRYESPQKVECPQKKVVYSHQLKELKCELIDVLENNRKYIEDVVENKIIECKCLVELSKNDNVKNALNEIVLQFNENVKSVGEEIKKHTKLLGDLQNKLEEIEKVL